MSWVILDETTRSHTENIRSGASNNSTSRASVTTGLPETTTQEGQAHSITTTQTDPAKVITSTETRPASTNTTTQVKGQASAQSVREDDPTTNVSQQVNAAVQETSSATDSSSSSSVRKVDAGVVITFSIPIRGGLFNDGTANPTL